MANTSILAGQWRWRWDLNPRKTCAFTRFRGVRPRPLGDSTAGEHTRTWAGAARPSVSCRAPGGEERLQEGAAFRSEYTPDDLGRMSQPPVTKHVPEGACGPGLRVGRAVYQARQPGQHDGARAHGARLQRDDDRAAVQAPATKGPGCLPDRLHFRVSGGIA